MEQETLITQDGKPESSSGEYDDTIANMDRIDYFYLLQEIEHR